MLSASCTKTATTDTDHIQGSGHPRGVAEGVFHAVRLPGAEILAGDRRDGEAQRDDGHEARLDDALADPDARRF